MLPLGDQYDDVAFVFQLFPEKPGILPDGCLD
jgi:hypothetical protein